ITVPLLSAAEPGPATTEPVPFPLAAAEVPALLSFLLASCWCDALTFAEPSTLAEAPGVCTLWLVLALAPACPGVTEALPEADPPAVVCATAPILNTPAAIAAIQCLVNVIVFADSSICI